MKKQISEIDYLCSCWEGSDINAGDTLLLHSSLNRTLLVGRKAGLKNLSVQHVLDSFLIKLGNRGTLILPLFNFDFTKGIPFDFTDTPSRMGGLTEVGRKQKNAVRTGHPIYSFCVMGRYAKRFVELDNQSGYGIDSPFGILRELSGKIAVLDLEDQNSMTFYHHVEEMCKVDYRYYKKFTAPYIASNGFRENKTYSLYVRDIERGVSTHLNPAGELMWARGLYKGARPWKGNGLRTILANEMFDFVADIIATGRAENTLFRYESIDARK